MKHTLKIYQKRLTNLSTKNRSLLLLRLANRQFIDLHEFDYLKNFPSFQIIENLIGRKKRTNLCAVLDSRDEKSNLVSARLKQIKRTDKFIGEEQGARDLYVGYPFVEGRMMDDTLVRCPLLFFPVSLHFEKNEWELHLRKDVGVTFNKSFLLAYSHYNGLSFDDNFLEHDFSDNATDSQEFRTELYRLLEQASLELNFGQDTFEDTLDPFETYTKAQFLDLTETGRLNLRKKAVLGIFPQAGSYLMPDYDALLQNPRLKDLEDFFIPSPNFEEALRNTVASKAKKEEELITPYPLDASQEKAIKSVKSGDSLVVQGPPGSGKSQLICNLIVDYMARGKNVLVVCQKKAALDVVYERLHEKNFADFVGLVHDFKNDRRTIYEKIARHIERIEAYQTANNSLDAIYLERHFTQLSREIDRISEELSEFKEALFDDAECGISAKELYLTSDLTQEYIPLKEEYRAFRFEEQPSLLQKLESYAKYALLFSKQGYIWSERVSFADFTIEDLHPLTDAIKQIRPFTRKLTDEVEELIGKSITFEECEWILEREEEFLKMLELLSGENVYRYFLKSLPVAGTDYLWLANRKKNLLSAFGEEGVETTVAREEIATVQEMLHRAKTVKSNFFQWMQWKFFSKEEQEIKELIEKNNLSNAQDPIEALMIRLDNRMNLEHQFTMLAQHSWLIDMPKSYAPNELKEWLDKHLKALDAKAIYQKLRNGVKQLKIETLSYDEASKKIYYLLKLIQKLRPEKQHWQRYLTQNQIAAIIHEKLSEKNLIEALRKDFDGICEFDRLKKQLSPSELTLIDKIQRSLNRLLTPEEFSSIADNSIRIAWIDHIELKYPILRAVSSLKIDELETQLQKAVIEKLALCQQIALLKVREKTYEEVEYNRLKNMVTYRDLKHQATKKRNIWPLRKLIQHFSHELLRLIPCWMTSPESVSTIFPLEEFFDLVIFDEASQCFAEKGIPAMYRGKQVVISGDMQQLPPYDLYTPRWEEDIEEDEIALEIDSLLDLGSRYLPELPLTGHYRSQSLALIEFSNKRFYKGQLQLVPEFAHYHQPEPSITYIQVEDGIWENNANSQEAHKTVELVESLLAKGKRSIGIITFNYKQQELIQRLLEERSLNLPPKLFVKNIENVQGDERDIIIFSVGYAPSPSGKMRLQFGSLNQEKGENRLNVAVTRARDQIYLICSILPSALKVDDAKNDGPKMLRDYLHYAFKVSNGMTSTAVASDSDSSGKAQSKKLIRPIIEHAKGHQSQTESLSFADLAVGPNKKITQLILTDDRRYHDSTSPKDAHAYLPILLKEKNWQFKRFYSRQLWNHAQNFWDSLKKFLHKPLNE